MNRIIAILDFESNSSDVNELIQGFNGKSDELYVFSTTDTVYVGCHTIKVPAENDTQPKFRNYVNRFFRNLSFNGFLHVISNQVLLLKDPSVFLADLEKMMTVCDYGVWFNTVCDGCNYVYSKYNSRMHINIDIPEIVEKTGLSGTVHFTSHSNAQWIAYDFSHITDDLLSFDEDFQIPMFWIIEFLARRRNTRKPGQLYYMNQYLTVESEQGVFY